MAKKLTRYMFIQNIEQSTMLDKLLMLEKQWLKSPLFSKTYNRTMYYDTELGCLIKNG